MPARTARREASTKFTALRRSGASSNCLTSVRSFPACHLLFYPRGGLVGVAQEASRGAFLLAKSLRHIGVGYIVDLMRACSKQECVHDSRHVARNALAGFRAACMMRMRCGLRLILKCCMAASAHLVGIIVKFQGGTI